MEQPGADAAVPAPAGPSGPSSSASTSTATGTSITSDPRVVDWTTTSTSTPVSTTASLQSAKRARLENASTPKNLQACDRCRTKKIKCVPIDERRAACTCCHAATLACTFDLPLTASRTKRVRRRLGLEVPDGSVVGTSEARDQSEDERERGETRTPDARFRVLESPARSSSPRPPSIHREGPSSISYILHSMPTIPLAQLHEYAHGAGYTMRRGPGNSQDGWIDVSTPPGPPISLGAMEMLDSSTWSDISSRLVETFLVHTAAIIPVVTRAEVPTASQALLNAMAAVAAARSGVPMPVFEVLRHVVQREIEVNDVLCIPTVENVQILLTVCLVDELAVGPRAAAPLSVVRARLAAAVRHAQDLGLDRSTDASEARIWHCARIIDIWHAAKMGMAPLVHVAALPPAPRDDFLAQLTALSLLLGRMLALMYAHDGVRKSTNEELLDLRDALDAWREGLPEKFRPNGRWSSREAGRLIGPVRKLTPGLLLLLYACIRFLLYRPMMRWSFIVPSKFELNCDVPAWLDLLDLSRGAIEWAANQEEAADLLFFGPHALCVNCLVQYHTWARRAEWDGALLLDKARRDVERWLGGIPDAHLPLLRRQLGVIEFLYAVTQTHREPTAFNGPRGLNPTVGVINRLPETSIAGVAFLRDASLPHGGVLVATQQAAREIKDLPPGTVILGGPPPELDTPTQVQEHHDLENF